jgi:RNA polymerase subunit RPABC4/transcription elongation factor Spt4
LRSIGEAGSQPSTSQGASSSGASSSLMPGIVACTNCHSRFAEGAKFCGRCGNRSFVLVSPGEGASTGSFPCPRCSAPLPQNSRFCGRCGLNITPRMVPRSTVQSGFLSNVPQNAPPQAERVCRQCGSVFPASIKFCGRCGRSLL